MFARGLTVSFSIMFSVTVETAARWASGMEAPRTELFQFTDAALHGLRATAEGDSAILIEDRCVAGPGLEVMICGGARGVENSRRKAG